MNVETFVGRCFVCQRDNRLVRTYLRNDTGQQAWACHDEIDCCHVHSRNRQDRARARLLRYTEPVEPRRR